MLVILISFQKCNFPSQLVTCLYLFKFGPQRCTLHKLYKHQAKEAFLCGPQIVFNFFFSNMRQCDDPCLEIFSVAPRFSLITYSYTLIEWLHSVFSHCMDAETLSNGLGV